MSELAAWLCGATFGIGALMFALSRIELKAATERLEKAAAFYRKARGSSDEKGDANG